MSRPERTVAGAVRLTAAVLTLALPLAACGNKKPPQPPPRMVPAQTTDLTVAQRGLELQLSLTYPTTTIGGLALPGLEAVEVRRLVREIVEQPPEVEGVAESGEPAAAEPEPPEPAEPEPEEPAPSLFGRLSEARASALTAENRVQVDPREFAGLAEPVLRIEGAELTAAVTGDRLQVRLPIEPPAPADVEPVQVYGVVSTAGRRLESAISNLVNVQPQQPPPAPVLKSVEPSADGIEIAWRADDDPAVGFRVYRRDADSRTYGEPIGQLAASTRSHRDTTARFGARYVYTVTAVSRGAPLTESALAAEREVDYQDRYPPPPPEGLVVLAESGRVRLLWEPSEADDVAGYRVYRRATDEADYWRLVDEPRVELDYVDSEVAAGRRYSYYITAVDLQGNESEASESGEAVVP